MSDPDQVERRPVRVPKKVGSNEMSSKRRFVKVEFGAAVIKGARPSRVDIEENIRQSNLAMQQVVKWISKPGVRVRRGKGVPYYSTASDESGVIIRRLNGKTERGRFVGGNFRVTE